MTDVIQTSIRSTITEFCRETGCKLNGTAKDGYVAELAIVYRDFKSGLFESGSASGSSASEKEEESELESDEMIVEVEPCAPETEIADACVPVKAEESKVENFPIKYEAAKVDHFAIENYAEHPVFQAMSHFASILSSKKGSKAYESSFRACLHSHGASNGRISKKFDKFATGKLHLIYLESSYILAGCIGDRSNRKMLVSVDGKMKIFTSVEVNLFLRWQRYLAVRPMSMDGKTNFDAVHPDSAELIRKFVGPAWATQGAEIVKRRFNL